MIWWIRFNLGLPARPEDVEEIHRSIPELLSPDAQLSRNRVIPFWPHLVLDESTVSELRHWAGRPESIIKHGSVSPQDCPADDCPLRTGLVSTERRSDDGLILRLMVAGGTHKAPKDEFLDLVRRVHGGQRIREVILSDPYIYQDLSEASDPGGCSNLVDYLRALGLTENSKFSLKLNPSPRKATKQAQQLLKREVRKPFPYAAISTFKSGHRFHDRFYLVRDDSGSLSGVFGPSLNGLGSRAVVLMGELERTKTLDRLGSLV